MKTNSVLKTNCMILRAGTSKGVFFSEKDMPSNRDDWGPFLLEVMGSPDKRQIDGLGGANSLTSKVAIVGPSEQEGIDVNYTFAQVSIDTETVAFNSNCGNISSGVGPFAIATGMVQVQEPLTRVMINNTNSNRLIEAEVQVKDGELVVDGDCEIPGVPGTGAKLDLSFYESQGASTGKLLPTGEAKQTIQTSAGEIEISIIDSAAPLVYMRAKDLGLTGKELHTDFTEKDLTLIEEIRSIACELCGFASREDATRLSPAVPKATVIAEPQDYTDMSGRVQPAEKMDLLIRMMSMQKPHQALAITGAVCTANAARVQGSLVSEIVTSESDEVFLGHPGGVMRAAIKADGEHISAITVERTARILMAGQVFTKTTFA
ncbi:2-methylaconitate cis-trans isomerase PrpF family protein [Vibrio quintilis]|uniref:3-methylitaconate isomerase n=1 Tax=Vibrio quintilis TaxID=1117707 RepID=A0A1M7YQL7_9VIBR|nr:PrpF domain-containing protein [Vibrio quintilis]SHO54912.1 3-methylitaconate isomerase [Vibrio quintilis]